MKLNFSLSKKYNEITGRQNIKSIIGSHRISKTTPTKAYLYAFIKRIETQNMDTNMLKNKIVLFINIINLWALSRTLINLVIKSL